MKRLMTALSLFGMLLALAAAAEPAQYRMVDLGTLGGDYASARSINEQGQIVGLACTSTGKEHAFLWQNGVMQDLGTLPGCDRSVAHGINESGQIVGQAYTPSGESHAFLWQNGVMQDLGISSAYDINDSRQIVGQARMSNGQWHAVLWQDESIQDLGTLPDCDTSWAYEINNHGQIVGETVLGGGSFRAFVWHDGVMQDIGWGGANAINESGQVVGWIRGATLWNNGTVTQLGYLVDSIYSNSGAFDINDNGQIVGWAYTHPADNHGSAQMYYSVVWQNGEIQELDMYPLSSYQLSSNANGINNKGQIVGEFGGHAVFWQPESVPEPSSLIALLSGAGGLCGFAFRRRN